MKKKPDNLQKIDNLVFELYLYNINNCLILKKQIRFSLLRNDFIFSRKNQAILS